MPLKNTNEIRARRRLAAEKRTEARSKMSLEDKLIECDARPGECKRERERLWAQMATRDGQVVIDAMKPKKKQKKHAV